MLWVGFSVFVAATLALDLGVFHRHAHAVRTPEALAWSGVWITLSLLFAVGVYAYATSEAALAFLTGWLVEKALSVDNLFVFVSVFGYFAVPPSLQHRVLFWGIVGAVLLRAIFITLGAALLLRFHFVLPLFGVLLVVTAAKMLFARGTEVHPERNPVLRLARRVLPVARSYADGAFFVREDGRLRVTPLVLVLVTVEATDVVFAIDSIPAIFGITTDPFLVFTSNVFAVLGLRALYFVLARMVVRFRYLKTGLGLVLLFVGAKMLAAQQVELPVGISLAVVATLLSGSILASLTARALGPRSTPPSAR